MCSTLVLLIYGLECQFQGKALFRATDNKQGAVYTFPGPSPPTQSTVLAMASGREGGIHLTGKAPPHLSFPGFFDRGELWAVSFPGFLPPQKAHAKGKWEQVEPHTLLQEY